MNANTLKAITRHGESLLKAFPNATEKNPVALCKKLRRIETSLTKPLTDACNGTFEDDEAGTKLDAICDKAIARAVALLAGIKTGKQFQNHCGLFVNRDPRGYALKLSSEWTEAYNRREFSDYSKGGLNYRRPIYTDMGGYGILAPDLNQ